MSGFSRNVASSESTDGMQGQEPSESLIMWRGVADFVAEQGARDLQGRPTSRLWPGTVIVLRMS